MSPVGGAGTGGRSRSWKRRSPRRGRPIRRRRGEHPPARSAAPDPDPEVPRAPTGRGSSDPRHDAVGRSGGRRADRRMDTAHVPLHHLRRMPGAVGRLRRSRRVVPRGRPRPRGDPGVRLRRHPGAARADRPGGPIGRRLARLRASIRARSSHWSSGASASRPRGWHGRRNRSPSAVNAARRA